jgi:hypothetical protein
MRHPPLIPLPSRPHLLLNNWMDHWGVEPQTVALRERCSAIELVIPVFPTWVGLILGNTD